MAGPPIFPPGMTRADLEQQLANENRVGLWICGGLAGLALLSLALGEVGFAVTAVLFLAVLAIGGQWEHGRRRTRFEAWLMDQDRD